MSEFFKGQMDYVYFIYGLAFFILFFICLSLHRQHRSLIAWNYLGFFGLIHGINEWLDLTAMSVGDDVVFKWCRLIIMSVSFICLFEFGRLTCERLNFIRIGRWIYIPILLAFSLRISTGLPEYNDIVRSCLGLIGSLWSVTALWKMSRESTGRRWDMTIAAMGMLVYGLAAGMAVNNEAFLNITGFPIQLLRGLAACVITGSLWHYYEELRGIKLGTELVEKELKFGGAVVLILNFILFLSWLWVDQIGQNEIIKQKAKLSSYSEQVIEMIDLELVKNLAGSTNDLTKPDYLILKNEFQQIRETMNSVRFIYLLRKIGGKIIFLVDSENAASANESPPGQVYGEASQKLKRFFNSQEAVIYDQYTDRWGSWVSAFTSLNDERTGKLIAVLGVDENMRDFNSSVKFERLKAVVLVGIFCLSLLLIFVYWQRFTAGHKHNLLNRDSSVLVHWGVAVIVAFIGLTLTIFLFLELKGNSWDLFQTTFQQRAMSRIQSISQDLQRQFDRLHGLCQFMGSNEFVDRDSYNQYVGPFLEDIPVHALAWVPRVKSKDHFFYESSARQDGLDGYQFYEKDQKGKKVPVLRRDEYFPVYYDQPLKGNEQALGFDEASESDRREAMMRSCDTGLPVVTPPLVLTQPDELGFIIFMPVYSKELPVFNVSQRRKALKGYIQGVYSAQEFLKGIYSRMPAEGLACLIEDPLAPKSRQVLYRHKVREGTVDWGHPLLKYQTSFSVADRQWRITIIPSNTFVERNLSKVYGWALLLGVILTALVAVLLNFLATTRYRAENLVRLRTAELSKEKELLRKREEDFHLILDSTAEAIYGIDLNGNCTFCNPSCLLMLGYSHAQQLLGKNMHALIHHSYPNGMPFPVEKCPLFHAFKDSVKMHVEEVFWRSDGSSFFVEVWSYPELKDGKTIGAVVSFWDVTERKNAEDALRKREAYLSSILDNFPYMVWLKDVSGNFLAVNKVFAQASNLSISEMIGKTDFNIWPKEVAEKYQADDIKVMRDRGKIIIEESIIINNVEGYFETFKSPIFDSDGLIIGTVGFARDITERKKTEEALKQAKDTAEQALAIRDEFTSTVSHELRTPLAAIKSSVDILDTEVPGALTQDQKVFIKRVKSNIDRLARLINDVLDLSKLEAGKMAMNLIPVRVETVVREVVDMQEPLIKAKGLKIEAKFGEHLPTLIADKDRLIQVLNNLINNALKFTKEGGIIVAVNAEHQQSVTISVKDTGVGIKEEDLSKLFRKFQQVGGASQQVAGTGLGLAICKLIIEKHNGRIWVESQFGYGSAFNFNIPVRKEKRILIVDDDETTLELLKGTLEAEEIYEIETASDGFRAGQKYYDFSPQLMILDINIPKINGLEVCSRIKSDPKTKNIKIIMISSFSTENKKKEAWSAGADEIINKPINIEELLAKVKKLI